MLLPKRDGGQRVVGIPTVSDRLAQTVVARGLEPLLEPPFPPDSYGYRPGKSATQALGVARQRCWHCDWVLALDIKGFFAHLDHTLLQRARRKHTACPWGLLYVARGLQAPVPAQDGTLNQRGPGVPQGGCIRPVLAHLVLPYAFDAGMRRDYPASPCERYADDIRVHGTRAMHAHALQARLAQRLAQCHWELPPTQTPSVSCKDEDRHGNSPQERCNFLGYTCRPRRSKHRWGKHCSHFSPAVSDKATKAMRQTIRSWRLPLRSDNTLDALSQMFHPILRGGVPYSGQHYTSAWSPTFRGLDRILVRWAMRKYKKLQGPQRRATHWLGRIARRQPRLFVHWPMGGRPAAGR